MESAGKDHAVGEKNLYMGMPASAVGFLAIVILCGDFRGLGRLGRWSHADPADYPEFFHAHNRGGAYRPFPEVE